MFVNTVEVATQIVFDKDSVNSPKAWEFKYEQHLL